MMPIFGREKILPVGLGKEAESKETLPAIEVANEVSWVNPAFPEAPFDLKKGKSTDLGLFLTPQPKEGSFSLGVSSEHGRSALLGQVIFKDKEGRFYRDIDLKGIGHVGGCVGKLKVNPVDFDHCSSERISGILDEGYVLSAVEMSEKFLKAGIRTERYLAIIELKEIVDDKGEKVSIAEIKKEKAMPKDVVPVVGVRAFGTKHRIVDVNENPEIDENSLEDARRMVAQELGINEKDFSMEDYLKWFAKTLGKNVGLMHKNKWCHKYLSTHNITLDCRIIDLDSVESYRSMKEENRLKIMHGDCTSAVNSLAMLEFRANIDIRNRGSFKEIFKRAYNKALGDKAILHIS